MGKEVRTLGDKIRIARKQANLTQQDLAKIAKISTNLISKWELNERIPQRAHLSLIAERLGINISYFVPDKSDLINLPILEGIENGDVKYKYDEWTQSYKYEKISVDLIHNNIFDDDLFLMTQVEIDKNFCIYQGDSSNKHIVRLGFKKIVDKKYYVMEDNDNIIIRQLFNKKDNEFYSVSVDNDRLNALILDLQNRKKMDKQDVINMKIYSQNESNRIVGIVLTSIRTLE